MVRFVLQLILFKEKWHPGVNILQFILPLLISTAQKLGTLKLKILFLNIDEWRKNWAPASKSSPPESSAVG